MPNWKRVIVSGSDASLNSLQVLTSVSASVFTGSFTGSLFGTASWARNSISSSFSSTSSFVNTLNQSVVITNALTVGTSSLGSNENTLVLGPAPAGGAGEGGQILLQAKGDSGYTSASMFDNWQNFTRLLRGSNASSDAVVTEWNMHTKQVSFPAYNSVSAFAGTAVANLAVDSGGNILTVSTSGGTVFPYTGIAHINGGLVVTGSITSSGAIHSFANGAMYFRGGDDAEFWDINVTNTVGIYGQQDQTVASIKLGNNGGTLSGRSGSIGVGTTLPVSGTLHVNGNIFAASLTGSLFGTASWAQNFITSSVTSASYASTASYADNFTVKNFLYIDSASLDYQQNLSVATGSFQTIASVATGSYRCAFFDYVTFSGSTVRAGTVVSTWSGSATEYYENYTNDIGGSTAVVDLRTVISGSNIQLQAGISGSAWSVRSLVRLL